MIPTLIDLHVRPTADAEGNTDLNKLTAGAREAGLDGLVLLGHEAPIDPGAATNGEVRLYAGVEIDTDVGRLLCYPKAVDDWFLGSGWRGLPRTNGAGPARYVSGDVIRAFGERGGVVVVAQPFDRTLEHPCAEGSFKGQQGLAAVVVSSTPQHIDDNRRAVAAAHEARLPCVAGSAAAPGGERFGSVATLFARPPEDQAGLVDGLRTGRVWPVEIGVQVPGAPKVEARQKPQQKAAEPKRPPKAAGKGDSKKESRPPKATGRRAGKRKGRGSDDNRGNRLDIARLRGKPLDSAYDRRQPDLDPIARLYGLADRKHDRFERLSNLSDDELDRARSGNRARGADPNVMAAPDFHELRAERQHVSLLLKTIAGGDERDSIALRFAIKAFEEASPEELANVQSAQRSQRNTKSSTRRRRRRRR